MGRQVLNKISIVDTAEEILGNADLFKSGGVLHGLSPDSVAAENVTRDDINQVVAAKASAIAQILLGNSTSRDWSFS